MNRNFSNQMPATLYHSVILECESSPYTLSVHPTEAAAVARLEAERRKFDPNCKEECWMWVATVQDGEVISKKHVGVESIAEANVPCL